jgi:hypothetical protein
MSQAHRRLVVDERVLCPIRGDSDVELCFGCDWAEAVNLDGTEPTVICRSGGIWKRWIPELSPDPVPHLWKPLPRSR